MGGTHNRKEERIMTYMLRLANGEQIGIDGFGTPLYAVATFASKADALRTSFWMPCPSTTRVKACL